MKYRLMDLLACPICKKFPLKLIVIEYSRNRSKGISDKKPICELWCSFLGKYIRDLDIETPCEECLSVDIVTGVIFCDKCGRWYPIIDEIPRMLPDNYRDEHADLNFLNKYKDQIPSYILKDGKPYNLAKSKSQK